VERILFITPIKINPIKSDINNNKLIILDPGLSDN
jgi:hypothetical protein